MARTFQLIALTPLGSCDPALAIAASRAGELGVLDLQHCSGGGAAMHAALAELAARAHGPFGVKLAPANADVLLTDGTGMPDGLHVVILAVDALERTSAAIAALRSRGLTVLAEATSLEEAHSAVGAGADGLVAKGHEAGGRVGDESTFVLLQRLLGAVNVPVYAHGGIGLHTAAACYVAGAAGAVLDAQLALTRESPLPDRVKERIAAMDGSETMTLGARLGAAYRLYARPGLPALEELRREEQRLEAVSYQPSASSGDGGASAAQNNGGPTAGKDDAESATGQKPARGKRRKHKPQGQADGGPVAAVGPAVAAESVAAWHAAVQSRMGWGAPEECVYPLGQDAAFAAPLAERFVTVAGVLGAIRAAVAEHCNAAQALRPLDENAPLAVAHGTRYPIAQGPMTRVSDTAAFALAVAEGGALPFLALALMRAGEVRALLEETRSLLGERPWGVGILGFVSQELRQEQVEVIREMRPPWALIAGGRPDQAHRLEQEGIPTYLHVPSPGLLKMFLQDGAHRFVFEGRECGGHVGPRTSFVLWETMIDVLLETRRTAAVAPQGAERPIDVLFAGGVHDARSAAMVAAMAAPLVERGMRVGVLMGTAYLFTAEAVASGAIMPGFQQEALACTRTVLLESGPGHATRCVATAFAAVFEAERRRLLATGTAAEEVRAALEDLNLGRLRMASKGIIRHPRYGQDPDTPKFMALAEEQQRAEGMYMIGQVAALRDGVTTVAELHHDVSVAGTHLLAELATQGDEIVDAAPAPAPADVAIVGISALLPAARDAQAYWENILNKVDAITEVPPDRWDWRRYFDEDKAARDRVYSRWGGFLDDVPFDPLSYGMPPNSLRSVEPLQLLTLEAVRAALDDAGYLRRPFPRERTAVILGASGVSDLGLLYGVRSTIPGYLDGDGAALAPALAEALPEWTEDSFPGVLMNVTAGRVTNRFDFGGTNFTVDAACASSLAAISEGIKELQLGLADLVVAGGADTAQNAYAFMAFSKTHALSPNGRCRPFDAAADGIAISEGAAIVVLKRLADAERDGDRIYAVIKGVGSSSDGRDRSLTAPRPEGQVRALERAYRQAGFSPATVGLVEAHGTGTVLGDKTEVASLSAVFGAAGAAPGSCAIGSVKSLIGHTKATAGVAGLIKVALALHHRTLPPTLVEQPNPNAGFGENAFYVNSEARPWLNGSVPHPRRAGVSAFGFGGTNFHVVLEEYTGGYLPAEASAHRWPSELLLFRAATREALHGAVAAVAAGLERGARPELRDLAYSVARAGENAPADALALAIVATSLDDLRPKLQTALDALAGAAPSLHDPRGIYFTTEPLGRDGKVAFLFPGQGSQYVNMLRDVALLFPDVRDTFEQANRALGRRFPDGLSPYLFPPPTFGAAEAEAQQARLTATDVAQPALGAADLAMLRLLARFDVRPDCVAGHSYGEFVALHAAGVCDADALFLLSEARGRFMAEAAGADDPGTMAAISADAATVAAALEGIDGVVLANLNAPAQTVISGTSAGVAEAMGRLQAGGLRARLLPVSCAFHSPLVAGARDRLAEVMAGVRFAPPRLALYSNTTGRAYPQEPQEIAALLADHLVSPVRFVDEIESMYEAGARVFIEVGPRNVLAGLADSILGADRPHLCIATDQAGRAGLLQLQHALGQMAVHSLPVAVERLFGGRGARRFDVRAMDERTGRPDLPPTTWLVNGGYVRPISAARRVLTPVARTIDQDARQASGRDAHQQMTTLSLAAAAQRDVLIATAPAAAQQDVQVATAPPPVRSHAEHGGGASTAGEMEVDMTDAHIDQHAGGPGLEPAPAQPPGAYLGNGHSPPGAVLADEGTAAAALAGLNGHAPQPPAAAMAPVPQPTVAAMAPVPQPTVAAMAPVPAAGATVPPQLGPVLYPDEISVAVMQFQQVMAQFLETQRAIMAAYFGQVMAPGAVAAAPVPVALTPPLPVPAYTPTVPAYLPPAVTAAPTYAPPAAFAPAAPAYPLPAAEPVTSRPAPEAPDVMAAMPAVPGTAVDPQLRSQAPAAADGPPTMSREGALTAPAAGVQSPPVPDGASATGTTGGIAEAPALTQEDLTKQLLAIVGERTGYPTEMLDLDLDLEADLGIDSIKRVEIVGSLRRAIGAQTIPDGAMEKLSAVKTLRAIVTGMLEVITPEVVHPPPAVVSSQLSVVSEHTQPSDHRLLTTDYSSVPRFTLRATTAPSAPYRSVSIEGTVVVTDDEHGIAPALAVALRQRGHHVAVLRAASKLEHSDTHTDTADHATRTQSNAADHATRTQSNAAELADGTATATVDLADPAAVAAALDAVRRSHGHIGGVVHLAPLRGTMPPAAHMDIATWKLRLATDVKALYYLAHAAGPDLLAHAGAPPAPRGEGAGTKRGVLLAATGLGGAFGLDAEARPEAEAQPEATRPGEGFFPGHGGIAGFLKTLGLEWPGVQVKAVDVAPGAPAGVLAGQLLEEMLVDDGELAVGRQESRRIVVEPVRAPLPAGTAARLSLDASSVILVTGGARGITAGVALELARRYRPTILLAGRSALPAADEPADTVGLGDPRAVKAALIARLRAAGTPRPAEVEAAYNRLLQDREMRATLADLRATGATVHYYAVDVRDEAAFGGLIDAIYSAYGRLDGVIHGAGVIEDKLVLDKTPASFDRVFDTKADSAFVLARRLRPQSLQFLAFFSSVTATFGNRGQADYGAANDVMNKLAHDLDARWPARVVAFNWGPWGRTPGSAAGMVDAATEAQFARRGVELIQPEIGYCRAVEELCFGQKGEVEIVYGDGPWGRGQRRMTSD